MTTNPGPDVSGFVLAGGHSSRMGRDKALLLLQDEPLLARSIRLLGSVADQVRIVGSVSKFHEFGEVVEDLFPGCGPLGGIHSALATSSTELNLMLAVDMPFVSSDLLAFLLTQARNTNAIATVPRIHGGWQPLCAVYRKEFRALAEDGLKSGSYKIDRLFEQTRLCEVSSAELTRQGFSPDQFQNLNTPEDLIAAERSLDSHR